MAPTGTYWGIMPEHNTRVILTVAALNDLELDRPAFDFKQKPAGFENKFPYSKAPAFEGADGFKLIEGMAIARYLCGLGTKVNLLGSNAQEIALIDQWIHFGEFEVGTATQNMMALVYGFSGPFNSEVLQKQAERVTRALNFLESHLAASSSGYLVGNSVSLADFVLAAMASGASFIALGEKERANYPYIFKHHEKVTGNEKIKGFWGKEHFAQVAPDGPREFPKF